MAHLPREEAVLKHFSWSTGFRDDGETLDGMTLRREVASRSFTRISHLGMPLQQHQVMCSQKDEQGEDSVCGSGCMGRRYVPVGALVVPAAFPCHGRGAVPANGDTCVSHRCGCF